MAISPKPFAFATVVNSHFKCVGVAIFMAVLNLTASSALAQQECRMKLGFSDDALTAKWRPVNDGVMGGRSSGGPSFQNGVMVFQGAINTNGGGFSSIRLPMKPGKLSEAASLKLRVKSDGRAYKVTMRTNVRYRGRPVSFQGDIPASEVGEWRDVSVPFDNLRASLFGRAVMGAEFDKTAIKEIGIIIADGIDGPFRLEVESIHGC
jgi:hypothetical protein